jgi:hypothetical protein|tara:strand:+ start:5398 stop:5640 length:243 start_codon:yes stop_codon:yes gene_type:complete
MPEYRTLRRYPGRFAGVDVIHPQVGQTVEVLEGDFIGEKFVVIDLCGYLYHLAYRVYVRTPDGISTWYWPWNIRIVEEDE